MAKQVKIKEIAQKAGVSTGTVDRILHNRGKVSAKSRKAVEKVLAEVGYKYNIHTSAISFRKEIVISVCIPLANSGEYWESINDGFEHALEEFSDIKIRLQYYFYDQYDVYSCRSAYDQVASNKSDAVIIGSTFTEETIQLCRKLDESSTPYIFVDSIVEGTNPYETYTTDQYACGYLLAKLLDSATPEDRYIAIFKFQRIGNQSSTNSLERKRGFDSYMKEAGKSDRLIEALLPAMDMKQTESTLLEFLRDNPQVKSIAVLNSRGSVLANILHTNGMSDIHVISFDITENNKECLEKGKISILLCQKPKLQGFFAIKAVINKLLYNMPPKQVHNHMPIDVIFKENLPYYREV